MQGGLCVLYVCFVARIHVFLGPPPLLINYLPCISEHVQKSIFKLGVAMPFVYTLECVSALPGVMHDAGRNGSSYLFCGPHLCVLSPAQPLVAVPPQQQSANLTAHFHVVSCCALCQHNEMPLKMPGAMPDTACSWEESVKVHVLWPEMWVPHPTMPATGSQPVWQFIFQLGTATPLPTWWTVLRTARCHA